MTLLQMENKEGISEALESFNLEKSVSVPEILDTYLNNVALSGKTIFPWANVKPLIVKKFSIVVEDFIVDRSNEEFSSLPQNFDAVVYEIRNKILCFLEEFDGIPFTIQRICELLIDPRRHYKRVDKYLRGFEKVCLITSLIDPNGNKLARCEKGVALPYDENEIETSKIESDEEMSIDSMNTEDPDTVTTYMKFMRNTIKTAANPTSSKPTFCCNSPATNKALQAAKMKEYVLERPKHNLLVEMEDCLKEDSPVKIDNKELVSEKDPKVIDSDSNLVEDKNENDVENSNAVEQMLRPIGQLEAFVQNLAGPDTTCNVKTLSQLSIPNNEGQNSPTYKETKLSAEENSPVPAEEGPEMETDSFAPSCKRSLSSLNDSKEDDQMIEDVPCSPSKVPKQEEPAEAETESENPLTVEKEAENDSQENPIKEECN